MATYTLAIDFGTSNTVASVKWQGRPAEVLRLTGTSDAMPSAVALFQGELRVGDEAERLAGLDPTAYERTPKRRLRDRSLPLGAEVFEPQALVAAVLTRIVRQAVSLANNQAPERLILTHPQVWLRDKYLLRTLQQAAAQAGVPTSRQVLVSEPVAAAFAYVESLDWRHGDRLAIVDFGGGTFDAAVLRVNRSPGAPIGFQVQSTNGIDPLGGDDFDSLIEDWVLDQIEAQAPEVAESLADSTQLAAKIVLREEIRLAKESLSTHGSTPLRVVVDGRQHVLTLTQHEFEEMIASHLAKAVALTRHLLTGEDGHQLAVRQLFLTGGSSQIPSVQRAFQALTHGAVGRLGDPKSVTALGAHAASSVAAAAGSAGPVRAGGPQHDQNRLQRLQEQQRQPHPEAQRQQQADQQRRAQEQQRLQQQADQQRRLREQQRQQQQAEHQRQQQASLQRQAQAQEQQRQQIARQQQQQQLLQQQQWHQQQVAQQQVHQQRTQQRSGNGKTVWIIVGVVVAVLGLCGVGVVWSALNQAGNTTTSGSGSEALGSCGLKVAECDAAAAVSALVDASSCKSSSWQQDSSVACAPGPTGLGDSAIVQVAKFTDTTKAESFFDLQTASRLGPTPGPNAHVPPALIHSENKNWEVATFTDSSTKYVVWLDRSTNTVGSLTSQTDDIPTLYEFWRTN